MSKNKREYVELASDKIIRLERERDELMETVRGLLMSADSSWEERGDEGNDWPEECERARKTLRRIKGIW
jgi:hypothetical protein